MPSFFPTLSAKSKRVVLMTLLLLGCFDCTIFSIPGFGALVSYGLLFILFLYRKEEFKYSRYIRVYLLFLFISCIYSQLYNGQFILRTLGACRVYLGICFSYYILKAKLSYKDVVQCLIFISILYCIGYVLQWIAYPFPLFQGADNDGHSTESYRIRVAGSLCAYMLFFYGFNMFLLKRNTKYLIYSLLGFIPIIIMGFRTLVALSALFVVMMVLSVTKSFVKSIGYFILLGCIAIVAFQTDLVQNKMAEMMERQESNQTFDNPNYIRVIQYAYFTTEFFVKPGEQLWGGGMPAGKTKYAQALKDAAEDKGYYWVDWGLVGLTWIIGVPAVVLLVAMYLQCAWRCKEPYLQFVRFTLLLLVVGSLFTTKELYRSGNTLVASFLFCCEYLYNKEHRVFNKTVS